MSAAGFYVETFGARELTRDGGATVTRVVLDLGGLTLFIEHAPEAGPSATPPNRGIEHIGLAVDDLDGTVADLKRRGIAFVIDITDVRPGFAPPSSMGRTGFGSSCCSAADPISSRPVAPPSAGSGRAAPGRCPEPSPERRAPPSSV